MPGKKLNILKKYLALFISAAAFIIYLFTLAPSVVQIDSGELAALQITLGIAHPTGYPLFTIIASHAKTEAYILSKATTSSKER